MIHRCCRQVRESSCIKQRREILHQAAVELVLAAIRSAGEVDRSLFSVGPQPHGDGLDRASAKHCARVPTQLNL
jgi:hypothetical protein